MEQMISSSGNFLSWQNFLILFSDPRLYLQNGLFLPDSQNTVFRCVRKIATIIFVMSLCLSVRPTACNNSVPTGRIFIHALRYNFHCTDFHETRKTQPVVYTECHQNLTINVVITGTNSVWPSSKISRNLTNFKIFMCAWKLRKHNIYIQFNKHLP
jgi:hypothetical protein